MSNMFDYIKWRGDLDFETCPFNKLDALIFAQLSYINLDGLLSESLQERKSIKQLKDDLFNSSNVDLHCDMGLVINKHTPELLKYMAESKRFCDVQVCGYKVVLDEGKSEQFAALTFLIGKKVVIAYRGTDDTIVGWKEDFNISFLDNIPSQIDALSYFEKVCQTIKGPVSIVGHSKGGNLVVYTASACEKKLQKRIEAVYNFDGPGFPSSFFESEGFKNIEKRLVNIYPSFSVVGMIFHHPKDFEIIESTGTAILQHDALTWQLLGADFVHANKFTDESKFFNVAFNEWVDKLSKDQIEKFVGAIFFVIEASGAKTNSELNKNKLQASAKMLQAFSSMDKETRNEVHKIMRVLVQVVKSGLPMINLFTFQK